MTKSAPKHNKPCKGIAASQGSLFDPGKYGHKKPELASDRVIDSCSLQYLPGNDQQLKLSIFPEQNSTPASTRTSAPSDVTYPEEVSVVNDCKAAATLVLPTNDANSDQCAIEAQSIVTDSKPAAVYPFSCSRRPTDDLPSPDAGRCNLVAGQLTVATDAAATEKMPFVNDCKEELWAETDDEFPGAGKGMVSSPQEKKMVSIEKLHECIKRMQRQGDQQPMRNAVRLIVHHPGMTVEIFARLDPSEMARHIEKYVADKEHAQGHAAGRACLIPAGMLEPMKLARAIKSGFFQLSRQFPNLGLPQVPAMLDRWVHPYVCDPAKPFPKLKREMEGWNPQLRGQPPSIGIGASMVAKTEAEYRTKVWQVVTFWVMAGMTVGPTFGIEFMTDPKSVGIWLPLLQSHYSGKGHAPVLAAIKRVAADLLGDNHRNVVALAAVQKDASKKRQNKELGAGEIERLRDMVRPSAATDNRQIWEVAAVIDASAQRRRLRPCDRDSRKSCAVATEILIATLCIAPEHLARIHLKDDIKGEGNVRTIRCVDHNGKVSWRPLGEVACERIDELGRFRAMVGRPSPWLFPSKDGSKPQTRQIAMTALARLLSAALRRNTTVTDLSDALLVNMIDDGTNDAKIIGTVAGIDSRTVRRRLTIPLDAPLPLDEDLA